MKIRWIVPLLLLFAVPARATVRWVSQSGGAGTGACLGHATISVATYNGTAQAAGDTANLCGTLTTQLTPQNSGGAGNSITIFFTTGASIVVPNCGTLGCIDLNGLSNYLVDGGVPCGYLGQTPTICNGRITATNVGTGLGNSDSVGIYARGGGSNIEIRYLQIDSMYVHTSPSDSNASGNYQCVWSDATNLHFHHSTCFDAMSAGTGETGINSSEFDHLEAYNLNWGVFLSGPSTNTACQINAVKIDNSDFHDWQKWDTTADTYHHDGIIVAGNNNLANGVCQIDVFANYFHGSMTNTAPGVCPSNCMTAMLFFNDVNHLRAVANLFIANAGEITFNGLLFDQSPGTLNSGDFIVNNTVLCQSGGGYCITIEGDSSLTFQNNVQEMIGGTSVAWIRAYNTTTFALLTNNAYQATSLTGMWEFNSSFFNTLAAWAAAASGTEAGSIAQTASLGLNSSGRQTAGSVLINAGANLTADGFSSFDTDILGNARPAIGPWDPGAFQGTGVVVSPGGPGGGGFQRRGRRRVQYILTKHNAL